MVNTKRFIGYGDWVHECQDEVMKKVNQFIDKNKIERSNILEFRTNTKHDWKGDNSFEVVISWWQ